MSFSLAGYFDRVLYNLSYFLEKEFYQNWSQGNAVYKIFDEYNPIIADNGELFLSVLS